jgi:adenylate cyclase
VSLRQATERWFVHLPPSWRVRTALGFGLAGSNAMGVAVVILLAILVVPMPPVGQQEHVRLENILVAAVFVAVVGSIGTLQAWKVLHPVVEMLRHESSPSPDDQRDVLAAPQRIFLFQAVLWAVASVVFLFLNARYSWDLGLTVFQIVLVSGWVTSCFAYLLAERSLRPVARSVLSDGIPNRRFVPSVRDRIMFAWALGTGAVLLGIVLVGVAVLRDPGQATPRQLGITVIVLGALGLAMGASSSLAAAQASSEPIRNLREALAEVEAGHLDVELPIYDGTEIGLLQAGFNQMVTGLQEREELRDLFGRHVGADVAKAALEKGVELGGEAREIAVLFVDIIGSTSLAEDRPPDEVVSLLNHFFDVVIDVVHEHEGWINKFEGDAALAIWGAPMEIEDMHTRALAAARTLGRRLEEEVPDIKAGIGVSAGTAVAGNVGTHERYEYTVIGDPVNEAARLTNHAKQVDGRVVANQDLVERATDDEGRRWKELEPITVRGRSTPTRLAAPCPDGG